jgi:hypothetical protein
LENIGEPWGNIEEHWRTLKNIGELARCVESTSLSNYARKMSLLLQKIEREREFSFFFFSFEVWGEESCCGFCFPSSYAIFFLSFLQGWQQLLFPLQF